MSRVLLLTLALVCAFAVASVSASDADSCGATCTAAFSTTTASCTTTECWYDAISTRNECWASCKSSLPSTVAKSMLGDAPQYNATCLGVCGNINEGTIYYCHPSNETCYTDAQDALVTCSNGCIIGTPAQLECDQNCYDSYEYEGVKYCAGSSQCLLSLTQEFVSCQSQCHSSRQKKVVSSTPPSCPSCAATFASTVAACDRGVGWTECWDDAIQARNTCWGECKEEQPHGSAKKDQKRKQKQAVRISSPITSLSPTPCFNACAKAEEAAVAQCDTEVCIFQAIQAMDACEANCHCCQSSPSSNLRPTHKQTLVQKKHQKKN